ncbi:MAG: hypothetical protein PVI54_08595 [Desulfobacteraceae bacterium]|jgi:hypothetical protein
MKKYGGMKLVAIMIVLLTFQLLSHFRVIAYRADFVYRLHTAAVPLPPEVFTFLAGEFKGMVANYLVLEAASFIGSHEKASTKDWEALARLLDQSNRLDPYFRQTYRLSQATLPWEAGEVEKAIAILERSRRHLPWDWEPGFFIGFDYYYFLNDNLTASQKLMEASKVPGAPIPLATLASRLASRAGHTSAAIDFLVAIYENTDDDETREHLMLRITALRGIDTLNTAVSLFQKQFDRLPANLEELVEKKILSDLPANPYERPYSFNNGQVDF